MAGYISLFDLGESQDDVDVEYNSLHHYRVGVTFFKFLTKPQPLPLRLTLVLVLQKL